MRQQYDLEATLFNLMNVLALDEIEGADIPGIYQSPEDSYRQGYNYALEKTRDHIKQFVTPLVYSLRHSQDMSEDDSADTVTPKQAYARGFNEALQAVREQLGEQTIGLPHSHHGGRL